MARIGTGPNNAASAAIIPAGAMATYSFSFLVRSAAAPSTAAILCALAIRNNNGASSTPDSGFHWSHSSAAFQQAAFHRESGGTYRASKIVTAISANTDYQVGGSYDGTNLRVYLNGALEATTAAAAPNAANGCIVNVLCAQAGTSNWAAGVMSEVGVWPGAVLTADDFAGLAARFKPPNFRLDKLALYCPLVGNAVNHMAAPLTDTGTPVYVDHPRVIGGY